MNISDIRIYINNILSLPIDDTIRQSQVDAINNGVIIDGRLYLSAISDNNQAKNTLTKIASVFENDKLQKDINNLSGSDSGEVKKTDIAEDPIFSSDEISDAIGNNILIEPNDLSFSTSDLTDVLTCPSDQGDLDVFLSEEMLAAACVVPNSEQDNEIKKSELVNNTQVVPTTISELLPIDDPNKNRSDNPDILSDQLKNVIESSKNNSQDVIDALNQDSNIPPAIKSLIIDEEKTSNNCLEIAGRLGHTVTNQANQLNETIAALGVLEVAEYYESIILEFYVGQQGYYDKYISDAFKVYSDISGIEQTISPENITAPITDILILSDLNKQLNVLRTEQKNILEDLKENISSDVIRSYTDLEKAIQVALGEFSNELVVNDNSNNLTLDIELKSADLLSGSLKLYIDSLQKISKSGKTNIQDITDSVAASKKELEDSFEMTKSVVRRLGIESTAIRIQDVLLLGTDGGDASLLFSDFVDQWQAKLQSTKSEKSKLESTKFDQENALNSLNSNLELILEQNGCSGNDLPDSGRVLAAGSDLTYKDATRPLDVSYPMTDGRWWKKFCELATLVNLTPTYWPIGLILPSPAGPIKIPFPIIWKMISVFSTITTMQVILIGQCGVLPSPFTATINMSKNPIGPVEGESAYFTVAVRPMVKIKDNPGSEPLSSISLLDLGNGIKIDSNPEITKTLPLIKDDFPAYERMSISNQPFLLFLNQWCTAGKKGGGFFEF